MITKTRAIVLHQLKYSESSVIVTMYTETSGRQSYMINGIRSSRAKTKTALLQPLSLLEIEAYHKVGRDVQRIKELRMADVYRNIPFDISKSTTALFLAELMNKVLRNEEPDAAVFGFIYDALIFFDSMERGAANFHLWFLAKLLSYLGYQLENNHSSINPFFDMKAGCFVAKRPGHPETPDTEVSGYLSELIAAKAEDLQLIRLNGELRNRLLNVLTECYHIHFEGLGNLNSLKVLHELFH
jgi:DNA repair protein RecO (recombination protein O)